MIKKNPNAFEVFIAYLTTQILSKMSFFKNIVSINIQNKKLSLFYSKYVCIYSGMLEWRY